MEGRGQAEGTSGGVSVTLTRRPSLTRVDDDTRSLLFSVLTTTPWTVLEGPVEGPVEEPVEGPVEGPVEVA